MKKAVLAFATAAVVGLTAMAAPSPAEAHWRGRGFGPGLAGGLIAAAVVGGIASNAYAYGPRYGYGYGGYAPAYYGGYGGYGPSYGYAPAYYGGYGGYGGYAPAYYGGYAPAYYPRVRRVIRPAYGYYGGPRFHRAGYYGGGPRFYRSSRW